MLQYWLKSTEPFSNKKKCKFNNGVYCNAFIRGKQKGMQVETSFFKQRKKQKVNTVKVFNFILPFFYVWKLELLLLTFLKSYDYELLFRTSLLKATYIKLYYPIYIVFKNCIEIQNTASIKKYICQKQEYINATYFLGIIEI